MSSQRGPPVTTNPRAARAAASAVKMIPARAWNRMRTGSGTKGTRHYDWAMLEVTSDDTPDGHADGHSVLLARRHRYTGKLSFYRCWTPGPVPLSRLITIAVTRWRIEEDHQLAKQSTGLDAGQVIRWKSWHRWTAICLLAYLYLAELMGPGFETSGNNGILDIVEALRWIRANIAGVGGDPDRVLVAGQSGGGGKVGTLLATPSSYGRTSFRSPAGVSTNRCRQ